ncbi:1-propanol dehydrogenase PduQ [Enterococcus wangshanyuanii]|uniref:Alcohol dehydrogenase n=1 Tax=Enterococcus wangshanyuanii TaxID=2005703 RepID=A0ABQ1NTL1_9ENTE|nr:1-propanol dehydrogenase PduQ [Enterococcus wangshanyuanii]GGC84826.1 alcohol dehydrogenase [Enterococcus wangshanyuanii]
METITFPTTLHIGADVLKGLSTHENQRIFIVTDPFMVQSNKIEQITRHFQPSNQLKIFSNVIPDPPIENVILGIDSLTEFAPTLLIAVGGGSPIDAAKAMKFFSQKLEKVSDLPFIVIPTTSGTGSEVTNFSVITNQEKGTKYPLVTSEIQPNEAYLASEMVISAPRNITADTGMDVLTHALEAYVSTKATVFSDALCEKVVVLVFENLVQCYQNGDNIHAREQMHYASCMAGMAFNLTSLGINHGIAHAAGAKLHVAHGRLNTLLLEEVIQFNAGCGTVSKDYDQRTAERYAYLATLLGDEKSTGRVGVKQLVRAIKRLKQQLAMPNTLKEAGVSDRDFQQFKEEIAESALKDGCTATNPKVPTKADILQILEKIK